LPHIMDNTSNYFARSVTTCRMCKRTAVVDTAVMDAILLLKPALVGHQCSESVMTKSRNFMGTPCSNQDNLFGLYYISKATSGNKQKTKDSLGHWKRMK